MAQIEIHTEKTVTVNLSREEVQKALNSYISVSTVREELKKEFGNCATIDFDVDNRGACLVFKATKEEK